jgi:hypothetical protein
MVDDEAHERINCHPSPPNAETRSSVPPPQATLNISIGQINGKKQSEVKNSAASPIRCEPAAARVCAPLRSQLRSPEYQVHIERQFDTGPFVPDGGSCIIEGGKAAPDASAPHPVGGIAVPCRRNNIKEFSR